MIKAVQVLLAEMGEAACYFLGWVAWAIRKGRVVSIVEDFYSCVLEKWIRYNYDNKNDPDNCYIDRPADVVGYLMGEPGKWTVTKEGPDYVPLPGEMAQARYEWEEKTTYGTFLHGHFVAIDESGAVIDDPMGLSLTVAKGKRVSTRVARRIA